ncbi:MAG: hypothetical protein JSS81_06035 [Acidobacteria bacterium]|nr:hypothetical protein [Acidobacteriota bacterium]
MKKHNLLLEGISQFEVDFVIPHVGADIPVGIDPFLLYKSRDQILSKLHTKIIEAFNQGVRLIADRKYREAEQLFTYPEVKEIGLGYSKDGKDGDGVGEGLTSLIVKSLSDSPEMLARGIKHIEEMQLISIGVGPDRISDTIANLIKSYLIEYTQAQSNLWGIKLTRGVPIENIFDFETGQWYDEYCDLPLSPFDGKPIILVPRRIVRTLPWINYRDYYNVELKTYLKAQKTRKSEAQSASNSKDITVRKSEAVKISRRLIGEIDSYISRKEKDSANAQPTLSYVDFRQITPQADALKSKIDGILPGKETASDYQYAVLEILNYLFNPDLSDGKPEVATYEGTERRDIIFTNESDHSFWDYVRRIHSAILLMFEVKNSDNITNTYLAQINTYLGDRLGYLGFIVSRSQLKKEQLKKTYSIFNNRTPRTVILGLCDDDLKLMMTQKCEGRNPTEFIRQKYRDFMTAVQ